MMGVRPALEYPNVTLIRNAKATKLKTNGAGTSVTEVIAEIGGKQESFQAQIVVVSCGAANSAKLLLESANEKHPKGLANGSDQVGRNYMYHNSQAVLALSREPNPTQFQKTIALNDFYFGMEGFNYPMGNIQMIGKSLGPMFKGEKPIETLLVPNRALDELARHSVDFWLSTEDLPLPKTESQSTKAENSPSATHPPTKFLPRSSMKSSSRCWAISACTPTIFSRATPI